MQDSVSKLCGLILLLLIFILASPNLNAQRRAPSGSSGSTTTSSGTIRGSVLLPDGSFVNERIRISLQSVRGSRSSIFTDDRGQFQFIGLAAGNYQVVVEADPARFEVTTANVEVYPGGPSVISIPLVEKNPVAKPKSGGPTVSAAELDTAVPEKARKEFERANEASRNGKLDEAIAHFRKAIEIYPNYLMARNDLGVALLSQGKLEESAHELSLAVALDPKAFNPTLNLGIVEVQQHEFSEAIDILKKALGLEGNSAAAHLYLGIALSAVNELTEAERELTVAHNLGGQKFAIALFHLGQLHMSKGQHQQARAAFEAYLQEAPNAPNAVQVRQLIAMLR
jgi:tetratricopeptide (TPR) repeat protein